ncbi:MAG: hypothetical protein ACXW27_15265 [Allosphingosinicella sp.]
MALFRTLLMAVVIAALSWFQFVNTASARETARNAADLFDPRPASDVLFIGNSRLFTNDLPSMVRAVADSADAPVKYRVRMWALPGLRLVDHARNKSVRRLLAQRWDRVVLQAQSAESMMGEAWRASFAANGRQLVDRARAAGSPASLVVNWTYSAEEFRRQEAPEGTRSEVHGLIQRDHRALAQASGAGLINVGAAFQRVETAEPAIPLTPDGVSAAEALLLRALVADHIASAVDA